MHISMLEMKQGNNDLGKKNWRCEKNKEQNNTKVKYFSQEIKT